MFEFDSQQVLLCFLLCYVLLEYQLCFGFEFELLQVIISFFWLLPILILDW